MQHETLNKLRKMTYIDLMHCERVVVFKKNLNSQSVDISTIYPFLCTYILSQYAIYQ